jgi:hypothetical protein
MFFLLAFLTILPSFAGIPDFTELAQHPKWQRLLHYKPRLTGGLKSEADGKEFFLSPNGKYDPVDEMKMSYLLFGTNPTPDNDHPICKFPLRFKWLNQQLGMPWKADFSGCTKYIEFFSKLAAKRATMVFSSYYLSNPNSAFGHTLLRLSRYEDKNETEMLDYGINYAAEANATNPFSYAIKGLLGGYKGRFTAIPYYYKIREYSNGEFRDLWSYDLKLTQAQIFELVDHIWELGHTYFDYFYFHENCSYHLISLLDVVLPEKNLSGNFHWATIPSETIRLLRKHGLIDEGRKRESAYSHLSRISKDMSQEELEKAKKIATNTSVIESELKGTSDAGAARILDASLEAFDYFYADKILVDDKEAKKRKEPILQARAANPVVTEEKLPPDYRLDSPAISHSPVRWSFYEGYQNRLGQTSRLEYRAALHDLLDPPRGSLKDGELEMWRISATHSQDQYRGGKLYLDTFSVLSIKNFPGQDFWASPLSWEVGLGAKQIQAINCVGCPGGYLTASAGNSLQLDNKNFLLAFLANAEVNVHNSFEDNYRLGIGPKIYSRWRASEKFLTGASLIYHWNTFSGRNLFTNQLLIPEWESRYHLSEQFSLSLKGSGWEQDRIWTTRGELGLQYFY